MTTPTASPAPPQWGEPGYHVPRRRLSTKQWVIVGAAVFGLGLTVAVVGTDTDPATPAPVTTHAPAAAPAPTMPPATTSAYDTPNVNTFTITLKTTKRENFGSAGSLVTVEPRLDWLANLDPDRTYAVTYRIRGDEDGPIIDTIEVHDATQYRFTPQVVSVPEGGTAPTARILSVEESS